MLDRVRSRDVFFTGLRGRAWTRSKDMSVDLELVVKAPDRLRAEILGPLGIRVGLLILDATWLRLYIPREKLLLRFPAAELGRDTVRRSRFLDVLPIPVETSLLLEALTTRVRPSSDSERDCLYDKERNVYRFSAQDSSGSSRLIWVDPEHWAPLEVRYYGKGRPLTEAKRERPEWRLVYSEFTGTPPASLPTHVEIFQSNESRAVFEWTHAEGWTDSQEDPFVWETPPGVTVRDY